MGPTIYWFRNDLRLADNPAFVTACAGARTLLPVYVVSPDEMVVNPWGFQRWGRHRRRFRDQAIAGLQRELRRRGSDLLTVEGEAVAALAQLQRDTGASRIVCETIAAPEERAELQALRDQGVPVDEAWQSSLIHPDDLPFAIHDLPSVFTPFRKALEASGARPRSGKAEPVTLPPLPETRPPSSVRIDRSGDPDDRSSFPFNRPAFDGAEAAGRAHVKRYFDGPDAPAYKATRNGLSGIGYSTKLSPWLATGALSPRSIHQALKAHEASRGRSDGTEWIEFELLWRDYFRFLSLKHGNKLFRHQGLSNLPRPSHDPVAFQRWCAGETDQGFVDAGMRELSATGYLSNRLRQVVASYLVHELACDWRAGAAWFEAQLIDYDVCSNHGNWLYIAGRGSDPRQGRRFDPVQQAEFYDPDGAYRRRWAAGGTR